MRNAYVLDVTRLTSRLGRGVLTGIDRVELAYLAQVLAQDAPVFGLVRTKLGFLLLARAGCQKLADLAVQGTRSAAQAVAIGVAALRPYAIARQPHFLLGRLLRAVPQGALYLNVGHANLSDRVLVAIGRARAERVVLIHDTIPLDHPEFARSGTQAPFAAKISAVARHADVVVHISQDARVKTEAHFAAAGRVPRGITAPLGVDLAMPSPSPIVPARPYFVALGTIEPRKNLKLLFDIWADLGTDGPQLVVIGAKGWADAALFDQLAALQRSERVIHAENLPDGAVVTLLQGAIALLFPSLAEGFGLPPVEAVGLGTPVIASDLPVLRETCGQNAVYLNPRDVYSWMETIKTLARQLAAGQERRQERDVPAWTDHFKVVLTQIG